MQIHFKRIASATSYDYLQMDLSSHCATSNYDLLSKCTTTNSNTHHLHDHLLHITTVVTNTNCCNEHCPHTRGLSTTYSLQSTRLLSCNPKLTVKTPPYHSNNPTDFTQKTVTSIIHKWCSREGHQLNLTL